ncbi:ribonuclease HII [Magnetospirillum sp. UT-4]|uniref:ribonuclease HII n=1 Tax=Magnetospirillum sp. UT-4 TaxID=2681467 RepID=UPI001384463A|nr:ribonuclease HII [Magnetospirillum sp. UT-4]CAA7613389.1 ribonuclease HII, degrades RNA of DNA-RNA hybrids [Magnetospirillum sp. UT-4]
MPPDLAFETRLGGVVCGIDEVGRGPLAGPVVAAAVILDSATAPEGLDDSKKLSARRRDALAERVLARCAVGLGQASVAEIDATDILKATFLAMARALAALGRPVDHALVDGNRPPPLSCPVTCVVGGDGKSLSIAAASVVAKVHRDRLMAELARDFPGYGWERNAGYGTAEHLDALRRLGPTPHHRRSFAPVAQLCLL